MNDPVKQQLCALVDAELAADEARFILRRIDADRELAGTWTRYHIAGECLRGACLPPVSRDFAGRVAAVLERESARSGAARWLRRGVGGAIAASVAVAAMLVVRPPAEGPHGAAQIADGAAPLHVGVRTDPSVSAATNNYSLLRHDVTAPRLDVEPASAVISPRYPGFQPIAQRELQPVWLRIGPDEPVPIGVLAPVAVPARSSSASHPAR